MSDQPDNLTQRTLRGADLQGANLVDADLQGMDLRGANLRDASLADANLRNVNLRGADLTGASLVDADLSSANLTDTTLTGADLTGTNLADTKGVNLSGTGSTGIQEETEWTTTDGEMRLQALASTLVSSVTLIVAFGLLAVGWSYFWIVFIIGFAGVLPIASQVASWYESRDADSGEEGTGDQTDEQQAALDRLRERYASGEIDDNEFEQRVQALLETESIGDAQTRYSDSVSTQPDSVSAERTREPETE